MEIFIAIVVAILIGASAHGGKQQYEKDYSVEQSYSTPEKATGNNWDFEGNQQ